MTGTLSMPNFTFRGALLVRRNCAFRSSLTTFNRFDSSLEPPFRFTLVGEQNHCYKRWLA